MTLNCQKCGGPIPRRTGPGGRRKFCEACSPTRIRKDRPRKRETVVSLPPLPTSDQDTGTGVYGATLREVRAADMEAHYLGALALLVAWHMDHSDVSGSALAALAKCHRETLVELQAAAPKSEDDPLTKLRRLRQQSLNPTTGA